ncbi:MAG: sulfurtransferase [Pseudomonadales bacterium]
MDRITAVSAGDLAVNNLIVFDCRAKLGDPAWGLAAFESGHIPGAAHLDLDRHLAAAPGAGGRHPLPDRESLTRELRTLGLHSHSQVVLYDDAGGAFAARAWWCLRWLGHRQVALVDGGLSAYVGASQALLETGPAQPRAAGDFQASAPLTKTVDVAQVLLASRGTATDVALLDARAQARFDGLEEPIDAVAGHIPGAKCHPFTENLSADGTFKPAEQLRAAFGQLPAEVICYCGSGVTAAHNVLALVHAGWAEPALYAGSWSHWILDPERPRSP